MRPPSGSCEPRGLCWSYAQAPGGSKWKHPHLGTGGGGRLSPRQAPKLLRRRSGVRRSGLRPRRHQAGRSGGVLKQAGRHFQPAVKPRHSSTAGISTVDERAPTNWTRLRLRAQRRDLPDLGTACSLETATQGGRGGAALGRAGRDFARAGPPRVRAERDGERDAERGEDGAEEQLVHQEHEHLLVGPHAVAAWRRRWWRRR